MSTRYSDRDYDNNREENRYGRRSNYDYEGSYGESTRRYGRNDFDRDYGTSGRARDFGREYDRERDQEFGGYGRSDLGYGSRYGERSNLSSERYSYPSRYRTGESSRRQYNRSSEYDRDYGLGGQQERGWWDRTSDEISSWFGDEEAERRRRQDEQRAHYRGRGPRGYQRSDSRISEDINDRLTDDDYLDASDIDVAVNNREVTLSGTVENRTAKRRAEDIAENVSGVSHVQNNLRIREMITDNSMITEKNTVGRAKATGT
jgi:osmotically-inducible protein OsmY